MAEAERKDERSAWCMGLRMTDLRDLTPVERSSVRRSFRRLRALFAVSFLLAFLLPAVSCLLLFIDSVVTGPFGGALGVLTIFFIFVGTPVFVFIARDSARKASGIESDLERGVAWRFEGVMGSDAGGDRAAGLLKSAGLLDGDPGSRQWIEVLPVSEIVLTANGKKAEGWPRAEIMEAAPAPENAFVTQLPREIRESVHSDGTLKRRRLSTEEIEELSAHARRLTRPSVWLFILGGFVTVSFWLSRISDAWYEWIVENRFQYLFALTFFLLVLFGYVRSLRLARRMRADIDQGWLFMKTDEEASGLEELEKLGVKVEVLPASGTVWTKDGRPSGWRMKRQRA